MIDYLRIFLSWVNFIFISKSNGFKDKDKDLYSEKKCYRVKLDVYNYASQSFSIDNE